MAKDSQSQIQRLQLTNGTVTAEVTPDIGGRLLSFVVKNKANFLLLGAPVETDPNPQVSPASENIGYLGHEIWVGPQSEWWVHQQANPARAAQKSIWPPDPYLILSKNQLLEQSPQKIVLQSPESLVSGVQLTKTYSLIAGKKNSLCLQVQAKNIRSENIAWDIWFNTRAAANTQVYVPVASAKDVRVNNLEDQLNGPLSLNLSGVVLSLDMTAPAGKSSRKGKLLIQPSAGWMAGFHNGQVLIIQFALQPLSSIHPEQGQVELYSEFTPNKLDEGLLEMEVHAPYKTLRAGESMSAEEVWTLLEYNGEATPAAQIAFLREQIKTLGTK